MAEIRKLSPDAAARLGAFNQPEVRKLTEEAAAALTPNSGNPVARQSDQMFTGTSYFDDMDDNDPIVQRVRATPEWQQADMIKRREMEYAAVQTANADVKSRQPVDGNFLGIPTQRGVNESGENEAFLIPETDNGISRAVTGGALELAKGTAGLVEWTADQLITQPIAAIANTLLPGSDAANALNQAADINFIKENFPVMPADNPQEKLVQELVSIVGGTVGGTGVATKADDVIGVSKSTVDIIRRFWTDAQRTDPKNAGQKLELFIRALLAEQGANLGATVGTPSDVEPMSQEGAFGTSMMKGWVPEVLEAGNQVIFDEAEMDRLGHFVDNNAFSAAIFGLGQLAKGGGRLAGKAVGGLQRLGMNERKIRIQTAMTTLKAIDPNMAGETGRNVTPEQLAQAATALGNVLERNKDFDTALLGSSGGSVDLNSTTAIQLGAKEYIEEVYGFRKAFLSPEEYSRLVDEDTTKLVENLIGFKQGRGVGTSNVIGQSDAAMAGQMQNIFSDEANLIGSVDQAQQGAIQAAQPIADELAETRNMLQIGKSNVMNATDNANFAQNKDRIIGLLEQAQKDGLLGSDQATKARMGQLTGQQLLDTVTQRKNEVDQLFSAIPNSVVIDNKELVDFIAGIATTRNPLTRVGVPAPQGQLSTMSDEFVNDLVDDLDARPMTFRELYTEVRPELSKEIGRRQASGQPFDQLLAVKQHIDQIAESVPEAQNAMEAYRKYQQDFAGTEALRQYVDVAGQYAPGSQADQFGYRKGQVDALNAGMGLWNDLEQAATPEGANALLNAMQQGTTQNITEEVAEIYTGLAIRQLSTMDTGGVITSQQMKAAIAPYLTVLERVNSPTVKAFNDSVEAIRSAEQGLLNATEAKRIAEVASNEAIENARTNAAYKFISERTGQPLSDPAEMYSQIFNDVSAPDMVRELMQQSEVQSNPLLKSGIQSQFLRYLKDRALTAKGIGVNPDGSRVTESSANQLAMILDTSKDNTLATLRAVFQDQPEKAGVIEGLLNVMNVAINSKAVRPSNYGSTTPLDNELQAAVNRLITITFGVLNPTSTKIRSLSTALTGDYNAKLQESILLNLDMGIANPDHLIKSLELLRADASGETAEAYIKKAIAAGNTLLARGIVGASKATDIEDPEEQPLPWFNGNNPAMVNELDDQTNKAFEQYM